ncbi:MAG: HD domain-containing protein [Pseudomonadota bacterium]
MDNSRNSDYDVTGTVQVSNPYAVREAVIDIFDECFAGEDHSRMSRAFDIFRQLFEGELPGYAGCDTIYHDMQHSLDVTLAMARILGGQERAAPASEKLGHELCMVGIVAALFHDAGYIRKSDDLEFVNGAQYTKSHVSRSARFLERFMPQFEMDAHINDTVQLVHYTGYEVDLNALQFSDPRYRIMGKLLGTADLVAQMADRCYLEKCRDRLYSEFVLGGVAISEQHDGTTRVEYQSGEDLLKKTPMFYENVTRERLKGTFDNAMRYLGAWFPDGDPYAAGIEKNLEFLKNLLVSDDLGRLRRTPPVFTVEEDSLSDTQKMVALKLSELPKA